MIENNFRPIVFDNRDTGLSTRINSDSFSDEKRSNTIVRSYIRYYLRLPIESEYTIDDMANDAIAVLDELNISQAHVLGISMGGMIAQIVASTHSDRTKTFTLIASTASTPSPLNGPTRKVRKLLMDRTKNPNATLDERVERTRKIFKEIGYEGVDLNTNEFYENTKTSIERAGKDDTGFGRQLTAILGSPNRIERIETITAPTLIIHGAEDPLIKVKNAHKAHKHIKNSTLKIIPDMRHLIEPPVFDQFKEDLLIHLNK